MRKKNLFRWTLRGWYYWMLAAPCMAILLMLLGVLL